MTHRFDDEQPDILDSLLSELLGGEKPPDVTDRVLAALHGGSAVGEPDVDGLDTQDAVPEVTVATGTRMEGRPSVAHRRWMVGSGRGSSLVTAACVVLVGTLLGLAGLGFYTWLGRVPVLEESLATSRRTTTQPGPALGSGTEHAHTPTTASATVKPPVTSSPSRSSAGSPAASVAGNQSTDVPGTKLEAPFGQAINDTPPQVSGAPLVPGQLSSVAALDGDNVVREVDRLLNNKLQEVRLVAAAPSTDAEFCRRAYVRLLGRIPTVEELQMFIRDSGEDKRSRLVQYIVEGSPYRQEFAEYWAQFWTNCLLGRTAGTRPGDLADRQAFIEFVREAIDQDRPWNEFVEQLLVASGANRPGSDDFQPAVNFLLAHHSNDGTVETAAIGRLFLARRYQCAQCHNHPFADNLTQEQFWQLNAFLRQLAVERRDEHVRLVDRDASQDVVFFERIDGYQRAVYPVLPDGTKVPTSAKVSHVHRRQWLARWIAQSDALPRATVNRLWAHFFGYGFTQPIDEIHPGNPISHPEVLTLLADQFRAHNYSLRQLISWIARTEAFGRSSRITETNIADAPEAGQGPWFSRYYTRQMQPEAVFDSLRLVAEARRSLGPHADRMRFLGQFAERMGTDDGEELHTFSGDIRQSLLLMTGSAMQQATSSEEGAVLRHVIQSKMSAEEKITHLFLAAVARPPSAQELKLGLEMLAKNPQEIALQDIWWALLNSNEFILDH